MLARCATPVAISPTNATSITMSFVFSLCEGGGFFKSKYPTPNQPDERETYSTYMRRCAKARIYPVNIHQLSEPPPREISAAVKGSYSDPPIVWCLSFGEPHGFAGCRVAARLRHMEIRES